MQRVHRLAFRPLVPGWLVRKRGPQVFCRGWGTIAAVGLGSIAIALGLATRSAVADAVASFADFPQGTYRYRDLSSQSASTLLLRKSGAIVIGVELLASDRPERVLAQRCFRGQAEGDRLIYVTFAYPPYDPAAVWESGEVIDLTLLEGPIPTADERLQTQPNEAEQTALTNCVQIFWR